MCLHDALAQQTIEVLEIGIGLQEMEMLLDNLPIPTNSRTGLCLLGRQGMDLTGSFVNQRPHGFKR